MIRLLEDIGCAVERIADRGVFDPRLDDNSELITQSIRLSLNGIEPFGGQDSGPFLAWRDGNSECRLIYMPHNSPMTLREFATIPLAPIIGIVELFRATRDPFLPDEQIAINEARATILERLESDPSFLYHRYISMDDYKTSRNAV